MKEQINKLKVKGKIYIWKYLENSRNYPGWNITTDKIGGESLLKLIDLMITCKWSSKKTFQTIEPNKNQLNVPNNKNGKAEWKSVQNLTLNLKKEIEPDFWEIIDKGNEIEILLGNNSLLKLEKAIKRILNNDGDFAIYSSNDDENVLYFWWNL